jgi:hypothetical protein
MSVAADLRNAPEDVPTSAMVNKTSKKKLRVIMLADEKLLPAGELKDFSEKQRELRKTEFDVRDAIETLGHEVFRSEFPTTFLPFAAPSMRTNRMSRSTLSRNSGALVISISTSSAILSCAGKPIPAAILAG